MEAPATTKEVGPGTVLGGTYRIERLLGEGGMGLVFEARHLRVPKRVAIKVLRTSPDGEQLARFRQEAEIASQIGHANIVDVHDFDTLPSGIAYLVMELLDGESLATRLRRGKLSIAETLPIVRQIGSALHAAHGAGVVHRDLKPENVFLVPRDVDGVLTDEVKILDFGISKVHGSQVVRTRDDVVLGTPKYMAPEQATGKSDEIDARADQFALGVMTYEMLAGRAPFEADNATAVMFKIVYEDPARLAPLVPDAPAPLVAAVERAMAKRPQDRFPDVSRFIAALTGKPLVDRASQPVFGPSDSQQRALEQDATVRATPGSGHAPPVDPPRGRMEPTAEVGAPEATTAHATVRSGPRPRSEPRSDEPDASETVPSGPRARAELDTPRESPAPRRRSPLVWTVPILAVAAAVVAVVVVTRDDKPPVVAPPIAGSAVPQELEREPPPPPVDAAVTAVVADAAAPSPDAKVVTSTSPTPGATKIRMSPATARELDDAEAALRANRLGDAQAIARRTLQSGKHPRAYLVLIEVACRSRDLGAAHAWMRNLSSSAWSTARARCNKVGFPIENPT